MRLLSGTRPSAASADRAREADAWREQTIALRASVSPYEDENFAALYARALREGRRVLRTFDRIDSARRDDLTLDTLPEVLAADHPRAYFAKALFHAAVSWERGPRSRIEEPTKADAPGQGDDRLFNDDELRALYRLEGLDALAAMSERERFVLVADAQGYSREEIAVTIGTSRANIDQIICRARRKVACFEADDLGIATPQSDRCQRSPAPNVSEDA